ncbi:uncharacterized protein LOC144753167 [Lissotriton helveticus]
MKRMPRGNDVGIKGEWEKRTREYIDHTQTTMIHCGKQSFGQSSAKNGPSRAPVRSQAVQIHHSTNGIQNAISSDRMSFWFNYDVSNLSRISRVRVVRAVNSIPIEGASLSTSTPDMPESAPQSPPQSAPLHRKAFCLTWPLKNGCGCPEMYRALYHQVELTLR